MSLKKITLCFLFILLTFSPLLAENSPYCRIIVYRNNLSTDDVYSYKILSNNTLVTELQNKNYFAFYAPAGTLNIKAYYMVSAELDVSVVKNITSYVRLDLRTVKDKQIASLVVVDSVTATNEIAACKIPNAHKPIQQRSIPQNQLGLNVGGGWSFTRVPMIVTTTATDATIGFGGGFGGMIYFAREFNDYLGMDFDLGVQESNIIPGLDNASVDFTRGCFSVTPFFIIPLNAESSKRLKIGAGVDLYFGSVLDINTEKIKNGIVEKWNYNQPLGYHIACLYEAVFNRNWVGRGGFQLNSVD